MDMPVNRFRRRLGAGETQIGLWVTAPGGYLAEVVAPAGFDWLCFDTEHSPNDPIGVIAQMQAAAAWPVSAICRPAWNDPVLIKRFLDAGAQTLLIPYVQSAAEAEAAVRAMRYPPRGMRGVSLLTRANRFGRVADYLDRAEEELCLLVQIETPEALSRIEEIAAVDGVDGLFIGPSDLATAMGERGLSDALRAAVEEAIPRIVATGKAAGILTTPDFARRCADLGATVLGIGVDIAILARGADALAQGFRQAGTKP
ncbi:2,4-dihydroxyhept-2-enedioate aldolase [Rubellimicrobium thermophilum DSM 16684]|uniref:2,4-dihydroxyhept-2-enedioate aldolase n=1 Tax=Rubellimicrobium thermophilum DSM 16684 TaxID=1123069 RepID=S9R3J0_9RHOB|nr:aldolase/citrate lyase family protein [Rubellimicrobium thermophilum]EPX86543.1 2,4-dihydroxyhept-2-enedioate aldolase [Rubellimicrobium thermophilum DSM 16684]